MPSSQNPASSKQGAGHDAPYYHRSTTASLHPQEEQRGGPSQTALRDWTATPAIHALQSVRDTVWFSRSTALLKFTIHEPIAAPLQGIQLALVGSLLKGWQEGINLLLKPTYHKIFY